MEKKINAGSFWPRGKELYAALTLVIVILLSGYITYVRMIHKVEELCDEQPTFSSSTFNLEKASIPTDQIFNGGPPKDGIPSLTEPSMIPAQEAEYLMPEDRVIGVHFHGIARAYPLRILAWHECVNDCIESTYYAVTYCPLCDSVAVFDREVEGERLEFGISGLLYQSNVLLYDRQPESEEESLWSQLQGEAVAGPKTGTRLRAVSFQLVCWEDWLEKYPETQVLSLSTGHQRDYESPYYNEYFSTERLYFPVNQSKPEFSNKEPILGVVINDKAKAYPIRRMEEESNPIRDSFEGKEIVLERNEDGNFFVRSKEGVNVYHSFWFSWYAFYPETEIYEPSE